MRGAGSVAAFGSVRRTAGRMGRTFFVMRGRCVRRFGGMRRALSMLRSRFFLVTCSGRVGRFGCVCGAGSVFGLLFMCRFGRMFRRRLGMSLRMGLGREADGPGQGWLGGRNRC